MYAYKTFVGLASINPVASSPLIGFGMPSANSKLNLSIMDFHGYLDKLIPYDRESPWCIGVNEYGGLISQWGHIFNEKPVLIKEFSLAMNCVDGEPYPTPYDGENGFECFERKCSKGRSFVRCVGNQGHTHPLSGSSAAEVAWTFMKNHPRQSFH